MNLVVTVQLYNCNTTTELYIRIETVTNYNLYEDDIHTNTSTYAQERAQRTGTHSIDHHL